MDMMFTTAPDHDPPVGTDCNVRPKPNRMGLNTRHGRKRAVGSGLVGCAVEGKVGECPVGEWTIDPYGCINIPITTTLQHHDPAVLADGDTERICNGK